MNLKCPHCGTKVVVMLNHTVRCDNLIDCGAVWNGEGIVLIPGRTS